MYDFENGQCADLLTLEFDREFCLDVRMIKLQVSIEYSKVLKLWTV